MTTVPNPGSPEARHLGCICATMDNAHGKGYRHIEGQPLRFVITVDCVFHWPPEDDFEENMHGATVAEAVARSFGEAHEHRAALA